MPIANRSPEWKREHALKLAAAILFGQALGIMYYRKPRKPRLNLPPVHRRPDPQPFCNPPEYQFAIGRNADLTPYPIGVLHSYECNPFRESVRDSLPRTVTAPTVPWPPNAVGATLP